MIRWLLLIPALACSAPPPTPAPDAGSEPAGADAGETGAPELAPCQRDDDCAGSALCFEPARGGVKGGACLEPCSDQRPCPKGSRCLDRGAALSFCLPACPATCPAGWSCADLAGTGLPVCFPLGRGTGQVGAPCESREDCSGGLAALCEPELGGYCALTRCTPGGCPEGSHCSEISSAEEGTGTCVKSCQKTEDCHREGYSCLDLDRDGQSQCTPVGKGKGPPGARCATRADCSGGDWAECILPTDPLTSGGLCAQHACPQLPCPAGSHCALLFPPFNPLPVCLADCSRSSKCRPGYTCADSDGDSVQECVLAGTGPGKVGSPCEALADCGGGARAFCENPWSFLSGDEGFKGGYCTLTCGTGQPACPSDSHCLGASCVQTCQTDADCRALLYTCQDKDQDSTRECLPALAPR